MDPVLFTTTGKEHIVSKDGIRGTVTDVKWIADDTIEIEENDYYIYLALLHAAKDKVLSFEEPELTADDDLIEREDETDMQHSSPNEAGEWQQRQATFCFIKRFKAKLDLNLFFIIREQ